MPACLVHDVAWCSVLPAVVVISGKARLSGGATKSARVRRPSASPEVVVLGSAGRKSPPCAIRLQGRVGLAVRIRGLHEQVVPAPPTHTIQVTWWHVLPVRMCSAYNCCCSW
ncbi:hypothetical protein BS78_01G033100 [Paspalum vaginatum]|nr:hypothetical protein BS78_01G033100 [Paspalum vaginatum]